MSQLCSILQLDLTPTCRQCSKPPPNYVLSYNEPHWNLPVLLRKGLFSPFPKEYWPIPVCCNSSQNLVVVLNRASNLESTTWLGYWGVPGISILSCEVSCEIKMNFGLFDEYVKCFKTRCPLAGQTELLESEKEVCPLSKLKHFYNDVLSNFCWIFKDFLGGRRGGFMYNFW